MTKGCDGTFQHDENVLCLDCGGCVAVCICQKSSNSILKIEEFHCNNTSIKLTKGEEELSYVT